MEVNDFVSVGGGKVTRNVIKCCFQEDKLKNTTLYKSIFMLTHFVANDFVMSCKAICFPHASTRLFLRIFQRNLWFSSRAQTPDRKPIDVFAYSFTHPDQCFHLVDLGFYFS